MNQKYNRYCVWEYLHGYFCRGGKVSYTTAKIARIIQSAHIPTGVHYGLL